jgi:hypothetical protein
VPIDPADVRALWRVLEPVHALGSVAAEVRDALTSAGLRGFWTGHLAARVAPLGPVGPGVAAAVLHELSPEMVERSLARAWATTTPAAALAARTAGLRVALPAALGPHDPAELATVVAQLRPGLDAAATGGRPLFAGLRTLPWPDEVELALWHAATLLREHRHDGRVAATTAAGLTGSEALVLSTAVRGGDPDRIRDDRGWSTTAWHAAARHLTITGDLDAAGTATPLGLERHSEIAAATDLASARALGRLRAGDLRAITSTLAPTAQRIAATGLVPFPRPLGPRR